VKDKHKAAASPKGQQGTSKTLPIHPIDALSILSLKQAWYTGIMSVFQTEEVGSIPTARSKIMLTNN
jgi:hypothetical protein